MFDLSQIYKILPLKFLNFLKLTHLYRRIRGVCRAKLDYLSSLEWLSTCRPSTCDIIYICIQSESIQERILKTSNINQQNRPTDGSVTTYIKSSVYQLKSTRIIQNSSSHKQSQTVKNQQK